MTIPLPCATSFLLCALVSAVTGQTYAADDAVHSAVISGQVRVQNVTDRKWRYQRHLKPGGAGELRGAVVCLSGPGLAKLAPRSTPTEKTMDQLDLQFRPLTLAVRSGDHVRFTNSDPHLHNVSVVDDLKIMSVSLHRDELHKELFDRAGGIRRPHEVTCNLHSQMRAWIYVFDHPWFAVTDENGEFTLSHVPAGEYRVMAAHAPTGEIAETLVEISPGLKLKTEVGLKGL